MMLDARCDRSTGMDVIHDDHDGDDAACMRKKSECDGAIDYLDDLHLPQHQISNVDRRQNAHAGDQFAPPKKPMS